MTPGKEGGFDCMDTDCYKRRRYLDESKFCMGYYRISSVKPCGAWLLLESFNNEDGNANDEGSEKLHFWLTLYFFVRFIRVLFSSP